MSSPVVIDVKGADDPRDVVHRAVQALAEGQLVAFPTETLYGLAASALNADAVERLFAVSRPTPTDPPALAVKSCDEASDYVPDLCPLGRRLARRCWPGPVSLVVADRHPESLLSQLPQSVQRQIAPGGELGLRVPGHPLLLDVLRMISGPAVMTSIVGTSGEAALSGGDVVSLLGDKAQLVIDDGRTRYGQPHSVVRVADRGFELLHAGVVTQQTLNRLASYIVMIVCTGNTCRSPMAERILRSLLAKRLRCPPDELHAHGVAVVSAGMSASAGSLASREAVAVLADKGIDLSDHESQPLTEQLVRNADLILTMTAAHRRAIVADWPEAGPRTKLVCADDGDVSDPIGGPSEEYRRCADQIEAELAGWLDRLDFDTSPHPASPSQPPTCS